MGKFKHNPHRFYIVFSPEGETPPKVVHKTHPSAIYAAVQMKKLHPDHSFFVMGSMSAPVEVREKPIVEEPATEAKAA
jgi:hypothetical protein